MNPAEHTARRLLGAIEEFAGQEMLALRAGDGRAALAIQTRAAPLIGRLCHLGAGRPGWWTPALGRSLDLILARRRESLAFVAELRERVLAERARIAGTQRCLHAVAPAYAAAAGRRNSAPRLYAAV